MQRQKRALAVHDISCVGRCSLTVALPIISAVGVETSILPTAVLSTHTGGFTGYTYRDLTEDILPIADHWESLGLAFDALYTGYLGSFRQIELVLELFRRFKGKETLALVDPAWRITARLYGGFAAEFPKEMRKLCAKADIIVPNLTEAAFMLDEPYVEGPYTQAYIEGMLERLAEIGAPKVVLTGVHFDDADLALPAWIRLLVRFPMPSSHASQAITMEPATFLAAPSWRRCCGTAPWKKRLPSRWTILNGPLP